MQIQLKLEMAEMEKQGQQEREKEGGKVRRKHEACPLGHLRSAAATSETDEDPVEDLKTRGGGGPPRQREFGEGQSTRQIPNHCPV